MGSLYSLAQLHIGPVPASYVYTVRNDSCGLWHQHSGLNSTAKLPARKKKPVFLELFFLWDLQINFIAEVDYKL